VCAALLSLVILGAGCSKGSPSHDAAGGTQGTQTPAPQSSTPEATSSAAAGLTGTWNGTWTSTSSAGFGGSVVIQFAQSGLQVSGLIDVTDTPCVTHGTISGSLDGNRITFGVVQAEQVVSYTGTVQGHTISGTYSAPDCGHGVGNWQVSRPG
jgi:hypothetical protein